MTKRLAWLIVGLATVSMFACGTARAASPTTIGAMATTTWAPVAGSEFQRLIGTTSSPVAARIWGINAGAVSITESASVAAVRGPLAVSSAIEIAALEAGALLGRCLGSPVCVAASAAAVAAYAHYRAKPDPVVTASPPNPSDVVQWDPGSPPTETSCTGWTMGYLTPTRDTCSPQEWCDGRAASLGAGWHELVTAYLPSYYCNSRTAAPDAGSTLAFDNMGSGNAVTSLACVPGTITIDGTSMANTPGFDGKCRTGAYSASTIAAMVGRIASYLPENGSFPSIQWRQGVQDAIETGALTAPGAITTTGPSSQPGPATTTTTDSPSGTTTTTTTPTTNYTYDGDTITYGDTYITTTTIGGDTTTTTGPGDPTSEDPCKANPGRAGCSLLGTPPTDKPLWIDKPITWASEPLGLASACPAPYAFPIFGYSSLSVSFQPACDVAPPVRGLMLALTALGCAFFVIRAVQS